MADVVDTTPVTSTEAASPAPEVVSTPAEAAVTTEPVVAPTPEPVAQDIPVVEPKPEPDAKPADAPTETPKEEAAQTDDPAPLPVYEPFTLPEGIQVEAEQLTQFTNDLAEFERSHNVPHVAMHAFGQKLVEKYTTQTQETLTRIAESQNAAWEKQKSDWKDALEKDPELGGNRLETTTQSLRQAVEKFAGNEDQLKEFRETVDTYAWGNNPALVRLIHNMNAKIASYETETARPIGAQAIAPKSKSMVDRRYGKMGG